MFAWGVGDEDGATGKASGSGMEGIVSWEGRLKHVPVCIAYKLIREWIICGMLQPTGKNVELPIENHVHCVGKDMPRMTLRNIRVEI